MKLYQIKYDKYKKTAQHTTMIKLADQIIEQTFSHFVVIIKINKN